MKQRISHDQNSATEKRQGKGTEWNREDSKTLFELFGELFKSYIHLFPKSSHHHEQHRSAAGSVGGLIIWETLSVVFVHCCRAQTNAWQMRSLLKGVGQTPADFHARPQVKQLDCRVTNTVSISKKCDLSYNK